MVLDSFYYMISEKFIQIDKSVFLDGLMKWDLQDIQI
jgi:hypothetical protein